MSDYFDSVQAEMVRIYSTYCLPRIVINKHTREIISFEYAWVDKDAEKLFNTLGQIILKREAQNRQIE